MASYSSNLASNVQIKYEKRLQDVFSNHRYINCTKLANSLQGSLWRAQQQNSTKNKNIVIKVTNKYLHQESMIIVNGIKINVFENIIAETNILKYLTTSNKGSNNKECPSHIVKYIHSFQTYVI